MKQLELKTTGISKGDKGDKATYADLIKLCLDNLPIGPDGRPARFKTSVIRERLKVTKVLEIANVDLILEDAVAETLQKCVRDMTWPANSIEFVEFEDDVLAMPEYKNGEDD